MKTKEIQRYERTSAYYAPIHCCYCGQRVFYAEDELDAMLNPCPHTLFIAHDKGFEYLADRTVELLRSLGFTVEADGDGYFVSSDDEDVWPMSPETITDRIAFPDALKVASYEGPPSGFGSYIGFAPRDDG